MEHFYKDTQGWFDFKKFYSYVLSLFEGGKFVEVGCWKGRSAAYMAVEILNSGKGIDFYCVDHWSGDFDGVLKNKDVFEDFIKNLNPVLDKIKIIKKPSADSAKIFQDESLDFVFLDASHDYESIKSDLSSWFPKIKINGVLGGHDYNHFEVKRAVDEWAEAFDIEIDSTSYENVWYTRIKRKVFKDFFDNMPTESCVNFINSKKHNFYGHNNLKYEIDDAIMLNGLGKNSNLSIVCDKNKKTINQTLDEHIFWNPDCICEYYKDENVLKKQIFSRYESLIDFCKRKDIFGKIDLNSNFENIECECFDLTHSFGFYAYGHLFDTLQRLHVFKNILKNKQIKFIVSDYQKVRNFDKHLSALCQREINENDLILAKRNVNFKIKKLYYGLSPAIPTQLTKETYYWILNRYFKYFNIKNPEPKFNLYLSRNHIVPKKRGVKNESQIYDFLFTKDFIFLTGEESLSDIIYYFANAKLIFGSHGSLFANCMFCNKHAKIIEICPNNRVDYSFKNKYKVCQNYNHVLVDGDKDHNIKIDLNLIRMLN